MGKREKENGKSLTLARKKGKSLTLARKKGKSLTLVKTNVIQYI